VSTAVISAALLDIVSDKTGYPVETLELDMDMEADLGIDSIKRVEILGAVQSQFPELPKVDSAALAELRTLGQITSYLSSTNEGLEKQDVAAAPQEVASTGSPFDGEVEEEPYVSGIEQGVVIRKILPPPDAIDFDLPKGHIILIADDGTPTTPALADALQRENAPVVVLRLPRNLIPERLPLPKGVNEAALEEIGENSLQLTLDQISKVHGPTAVFVHLAVHGQNSVGLVDFSEAEKAEVKLAFLTAKYLKAEINAAAEKGRAAFMTVTRLDGAFGLGDEEDFTPVNGGLFGLVKTLNLEWDAVFCRALDLSPALDTVSVVHDILAELHDPNRLIAEVGYTTTERSTLTIAAVPVTGGKL
jgi:acyl carrier protein